MAFLFKKKGEFLPPTVWVSGHALSSGKAARRDEGRATKCPAAPYRHDSSWRYVSHPVLEIPTLTVDVGMDVAVYVAVGIADASRLFVAHDFCSPL